MFSLLSFSNWTDDLSLSRPRSSNLCEWEGYYRKPVPVNVTPMILMTIADNSTHSISPLFDRSQQLPESRSFYKLTANTNSSLSAVISTVRFFSVFICFRPIVLSTIFSKICSKAGLKILLNFQQRKTYFPSSWENTASNWFWWSGLIRWGTSFTI